VSPMSGHVSSDRLGEAATHAGLDVLPEHERRHVEGCERCRRLYAGYRLTDRLLAVPWRDVKLPPAAVARPSRLGAAGAFLRGLDARSLAPALAAIAIVALIGTAFALPQLISAPPPSGSHSPAVSSAASPSPSGRQTVSPSGPGRSEPSPGGEPAGPGSSSTPGSTPGSTGSAGKTTIGITKLGGSPIAWSPDGAHLLLWGPGSARQLLIRDATGHLLGSVAADAATWVSSTRIAVASHTSGASPSESAGSGPGHRGNNGGPSRSGGSGGGGGTGGETVSIIDIAGHTVGTLPGTFAPGGGLSNGMLVGSGTGELTIASPGGFGSSGWSFVLWNGAVSAVQDGLPIAFSQDGRSLAVLHPWSASGGAVSGWLEILAVPSLDTVASFTHTSLRVGTGSMGSGYSFDAAFSPAGGYLLASGTLVNLSNGATVATGKGGWLPDGTLVTASNAGLLRWQGGHSSVDPRFPGQGTIEVSRHGDLIYFYGDGRPPLLLNAAGSLDALTLSGVRSIASLLISPSGRAIAFDGRATDGSSITAVAALP